MALRSIQITVNGLPSAVLRGIYYRGTGTVGQETRGRTAGSRTKRRIGGGGRRPHCVLVQDGNSSTARARQAEIAGSRRGGQLEAGTKGRDGQEPIARQALEPSAGRVGTYMYVQAHGQDMKRSRCCGNHSTAQSGRMHNFVEAALLYPGVLPWRAGRLCSIVPSKFITKATYFSGGLGTPGSSHKV